MLCQALVEQARDEHMSDRYKTRCIIVVLLKPTSWVYQDKHEITTVVPRELIKKWKSQADEY